MLSSITKISFCSLLLLSSARMTQAQVFQAPAGPEYIFGDPSIKPQSISCYSFRGDVAQTPFGSIDVYLSGRSNPSLGAASEVTWQFSASGNPMALLTQGSIPYMDVADLEVGAVRNFSTNTVQVLVAYYRIGVGHFLDIYDITTSTTNPIQLSSSMQLSNSLNYGRIRMDSHSTELRRVALVWEYPGQELQTIVCEDGNWSGVSDLSGTANAAGPDIAFNRNANDLNIHYVYHDPSGSVITESKLDFFALMGTPGAIAPIVEDINVLPGTTSLRSRLVLDCPDDYNVDNWAYTYTDNTDARVWVRLIDYNTGTGPTTISVTDGTLGNAPITGIYKAFTPALHYGLAAIAPGFPGATDEITVAWYSTDGAAFNTYLALEMKASGTGLITAPDYLLLPNANTPSIYPNMPFCGIALSKSDIKYAPDYLYAAFYDYDNSTSDYNLHHAFHQWGNSVFRKQLNWDEVTTGTYPNPFDNQINTTFNLKESTDVQVQLFDISGRLVAQNKATLAVGIQEITIRNLENLSPGTYFLNTTLNGKAAGSKPMVKQ